MPNPSCLPHTSPFVPGEWDIVAYQCAPSLPSQLGAPSATLATDPAPTATPPTGSGVSVLSVTVEANPLTGLQTDLWIKVDVVPGTPAGEYPILLAFKSADGVAAKPRTLVIPVVAAR
jgi:hypothetical protein